MDERSAREQAYVFAFEAFDVDGSGLLSAVDLPTVLAACSDLSDIGLREEDMRWAKRRHGVSPGGTMTLMQFKGIAEAIWKKKAEPRQIPERRQSPAAPTQRGNESVLVGRLPFEPHPLDVVAQAFCTFDADCSGQVSGVDMERMLRLAAGRGVKVSQAAVTSTCARMGKRRGDLYTLAEFRAVYTAVTGLPAEPAGPAPPKRRGVRPQATVPPQPRPPGPGGPVAFGEAAAANPGKLPFDLPPPVCGGQLLANPDIDDVVVVARRRPPAEAAAGAAELSCAGTMPLHHNPSTPDRALGPRSSGVSWTDAVVSEPHRKTVAVASTSSEHTYAAEAQETYAAEAGDVSRRASAVQPASHPAQNPAPSAGFAVPRQQLVEHQGECIKSMLDEQRALDLQQEEARQREAPAVQRRLRAELGLDEEEQLEPLSKVTVVDDASVIREAIERHPNIESCKDEHIAHAGWPALVLRDVVQKRAVGLRFQDGTVAWYPKECVRLLQPDDAPNSEQTDLAPPTTVPSTKSNEAPNRTIGTGDVPLSVLFQSVPSQHTAAPGSRGRGHAEGVDYYHFGLPAMHPDTSHHLEHHPSVRFNQPLHQTPVDPPSNYTDTSLPPVGIASRYGPPQKSQYQLPAVPKYDVAELDAIYPLAEKRTDVRVGELQLVFKLFDVHKEGEVAREDLHIMLRALGYTVPKREVAAVVDKAGKSLMGRMEFEEFEKHVRGIGRLHKRVKMACDLAKTAGAQQPRFHGRSAAVPRPLTSDELRALFYLFDDTGEGALNRSQLAICLNSAGLEDTREVDSFLEVDNLLQPAPAPAGHVRVTLESFLRLVKQLQASALVNHHRETSTAHLDFPAAPAPSWAGLSTY